MKATANLNMTMLDPAQISRPDKRIHHESNQMRHGFEHGMVFGKVMHPTAEIGPDGLRRLHSDLPPSFMP
jgi:hypothetical protein